MSQFNTSIRKLNKIWQRVQRSINQGKLKDNSDKLDFFTNLLKQQNFKVPIEVFDTGQLNITPARSSISFTAFKAEKMPIVASYSQNIDIQIPEILLPFVKYSIEVQPTPGTSIHGVYEYDPSTWTGDNIEVKGDGTLIWKGNSVVTTSFSIPFGITHSEADLVSKGISLTLTKETWTATIERTDPLSDGFGKVMKVSGTTETAGLCGSNNDTNVFEIEHLDNKNHKITAMDNTSVTGIGRETITTYDAGCVSNVVINDNVIRTINFNTVNDYTINLAQATTLGLGFDKDDIENLQIEKTDRWLFYSTELQKIFKTVVTNPNDGDFSAVQLDNLPDTNQGDILPYTNITLKRNLDGTNDLPTQLRQSSGQLILGGGDRPNSSFLSSLAITERKYKNYIKISPSTDPTPTYRFNLSGNYIIVGKSTTPKIVTVIDPDPDDLNFELVDLDARGVTLGSGDRWQIHIEQPGDDRIGLLNGVEILETDGDSTILFNSNKILNPTHNISDINSLSFTAIGDETITEVIDGETVITVNTNVTKTKFFDEGTTSFIINETVNFPVYDDLYTVVGTTYNLTTETHTMFAKQLWTPSTDDTTINIKAYLTNPLYWREQRRYLKNDV